jgi:hypothetical protein
MPVIQSLLPLNDVIQLPNFFDALDIVLLSVDPGTNWVPLMLPKLYVIRSPLPSRRASPALTIVRREGL